MTNELTTIEIALLQELTGRNATIGEIAEHFSHLKFTEVTQQSTHYVGGYRKWTLEQEDFISDLALDLVPIEEICDKFITRFDFSRSEGALTSRLKRLGFSEYNKLVEQYRIESKRRQRLARPGFQRFIRSK